MESIIIPSTKSLTLTNKIPDGNINENNITVGNDGQYTYSSFLFFDISGIPSNAEIFKAELVLFKTDNFYNDNRKCIYIYPLLDYFSTYTTYNNPPEVTYIIEGKIYPLTSKISATTNVTKIVSLWFKHTASNKGIILCKKNNNFITNFGSAICKDNYLTPFIKVTYNMKNTVVKHENHINCKRECNRQCCCKCNHDIKNCTQMKVIYYPCQYYCPPTPPVPPTPVVPTIRQVQVVGTVAAYSIYLIIVTLEVTRSGTGHIDKYYITDEYDNSASSTPLAIDKTYDIAVIPPITLGDTETVNFAGSYKG